MLDHVQKENLQEDVAVSASFCFENCDKGPTVSVNGCKLSSCTAAAARSEVDQKMKEKK
jgi:NADH-quinone oxidoreductase subunit G